MKNPKAKQTKKTSKRTKRLTDDQITLRFCSTTETLS